MGDILSQSEIDELLKALTSGDVDVSNMETEKKERRVKDYDFARPSKFNKDQLRTLEIVFDNYARLISSFFTGYLRTPTHIEVINSEQLTYSEFSNSLSTPVILGMFEILPLKGTAVLELSANIGYSIIDRILGGQGATLPKLRDFSEIEKILLERVIIQLLSFLPEPWENLMTVTPKLDKIETNSQFAQIINPNEMIALVTLTIKIGEVEGLINFCLPHIVLEPIMDRLYTRIWFGASDDVADSQYRDKLEARLETAKIPLKVVLGRTSITVGDFVNLQAGDVIALDSYNSSDLDVVVGSLLKFKGKPGINKGKNAIQVTSIIRKDE